MADVLKQYEGKIKLYYKQYPLDFHPWAKPAAIASLCAYSQSPDAFWKFHDAIFTSQSAINQGNVNDKMKEFAKTTNLNTSKFEACLKESKIAEQVNTEFKEGQSLGVTGTPTFFINGQKLVGALPLDAFKPVIDAALKEKAPTK